MSDLVIHSPLSCSVVIQNPSRDLIFPTLFNELARSLDVLPHLSVGPLGVLGVRLAVVAHEGTPSSCLVTGQ